MRTDVGWFAVSDAPLEQGRSLESCIAMMNRVEPEWSHKETLWETVAVNKGQHMLRTAKPRN